MTTVINGSSPSITFSDSTTQSTSAVVSGKVPTSLMPTGSVIQVVQTVKTSVFTSTTSLPSFIDVTGASATITPTSASNKILVTVSGAVGNGSATYTSAINLVRGSTSIFVGDARGSATSCSQGFNPNATVTSGNISLCYLDSPATTSATTYKLQLGTESVGTAYIGGTGRSDVGAALNIPTVITLQEIVA